MMAGMATPLPGADVIAGLRAHARSARRLAVAVLVASIASLATAQMLAERAPTREGTRPFAWLALAVLALAVPAMALTQAVWGARSRAVRLREQALYARPSSGPRHAACRLGVAAGWALTLLLGFTVPRLFMESALYGLAGATSQAIEVVALAGFAAGVFFAIWWTRDALVHRTASPSDPWDPGRQERGGERRAAWAGAATATFALVAARAHLWEPGTWLLYALFGVTLACLLAAWAGARRQGVLVTHE
ncbi:hypothetical protein GCM10010404_10580 [Nonomuraea africana]